MSPFPIGLNSMSPEQREQLQCEFLNLLDENDGNITKTCKQLRIKGMHTTISKWKKANPAFAEGVNAITHAVFDDIESSTMRQARREHYFPAQRFLLLSHPEGKRRGYGKRNELTGADGTDVFRSLVDMMNVAFDGDDGKTADAEDE